MKIDLHNLKSNLTNIVESVFYISLIAIMGSLIILLIIGIVALIVTVGRAA